MKITPTFKVLPSFCEIFPSENNLVYSNFSQFVNFTLFRSSAGMTEERFLCDNLYEVEFFFNVQDTSTRLYTPF